MTKAGWVRGALGAYLVSSILAVTPAAGDPIDDCFDYANSSWSDDYLTCAGTGDGCSICVGSIVVYKLEDIGGAASPLGTELAAILPGSYDADRWLGRGEAPPPGSSIGEFLRVEHGCSEDPGLFDAVDPRQRPPVVPARRSAAAPDLPPAPAP
ncbi:MAG: hypothetical protein OXG74_02550 [Acidobacteria bacterium]|nr:hypothetical protein [Acidobacteriota bacterium]